MKKGLSLLLAASMAFSAFSVTAFAADPQTAQEKYEALVEAGIFQGFEDGSSRLDEPMTRAQAAKIVALLLGVEEDAAAAAIYTDLVGAEWAAGFIGAATEAGVLEGRGNGVFDPSANVSIQELAKIMVEVLDLEVDADATAEGADEWAQAYVAAAVAAGVIPQQSDYTAAASRTILVEASFTAYGEVSQPAEIGIAKVEATDAAVLTVSFNGAIDTEAAKFAVTKNGASTSVKEVKFADDKRSAQLTLDPKLTNATYEVTLSGISNLDADMAKASVQAQDEKIAKIEFLTASETISQAEDVKIEFQALNQYGKKAAMKTSDFEIRISDRLVEPTLKNVQDETAFTIDTYLEEDGRNQLERNDRISITITHQESGISTNAIYTIGDEPWISKVELGDLLDDQGDKIDYIRADVGEAGYLKVVAYDQYGVKVSSKKVLNGEIGSGISAVTSDNRTLDVGIIDSSSSSSRLTTDEDTAFNEDVDGDGVQDLRLTVLDTVDKEVTISIFASGTTATKTVQVRSTKNAASFEFPANIASLADGDENKYIPVIIKDSEGNTLSAQDIVDNFEDDKIRVSATGPVRLAANEIKTTGDDKGKIHVEYVRGTGSSKVEIYLKDSPSVSASTNISTGKERYPERLSWKEALADQLLIGANDKFDFSVLDQYGADYKKYFNTTDYNAGNEHATEDELDYRVGLTIERVTGTGTVQLWTPNDDVAYHTTIDDEKEHTDSAKQITGRETDGKILVNVGETVWYDNFNQFFDKEFDLKSISGKGTVRITAKIYDKDAERVRYELTKTVSVIDGAESNVDLSYSVNLKKLNADSTIMAVQEVYEDYNATVTGSTYGDLGRENVTPETLWASSAAKNLGKEIEIKAKQGSRDVATGAKVVAVRSSNPSVVQGSHTNGTGYIFGYDAGTATVTVSFETPTGIEEATMEVKVVEALPQVESIALAKSSRAIALSDLTAGLNIQDAKAAEKITVKDQFANEFVSEKDKTPHVANYNHLLRIGYTVSNIKWVSGTGSNDDVTATNGVIQVHNNNVKSFTVNITAPNGKKATFEVSVDR